MSVELAAEDIRKKIERALTTGKKVLARYAGDDWQRIEALPGDVSTALFLFQCALRELEKPDNGRAGEVCLEAMDVWWPAIRKAQGKAAVITRYADADPGEVRFKAIVLAVYREASQRRTRAWPSKTEAARAIEAEVNRQLDAAGLSPRKADTIRRKIPSRKN